MTILAIETSCDDTCIAVLEIRKQPSGESASRPAKFEIRKNFVSSQVEIHKKYGGVYPMMAKREHQKNLPIILKKALKKTKIDLIAVTVGPGLEPCLWVGVNFAKELAKNWKLPIIPVNHIEAHIVANFVDKVKNSKFKSQNFPAVCLVVSGGHTQLILMKDLGKYKILGETRDDAAGECFDKIARILGLGYPGGPAIAVEANRDPVSVTNRDRVSVQLPRPMINQKNYDFSFSGLKTAVLYISKRSLAPRGELSSFKEEMCKEVQQAIIDVLIKKTIKAAKDFGAKTIILGGGVAANSELRKQFRYKLQTTNYKLNFLVPPKKFCTDNAVMVAIAGYFNLNKKNKDWKKIKADANLKIA